MKQVFISCDECNDDRAESYSVIIDKEADPSGNGYNNVYNHYDWCFECLIKYAQSHPNQKIVKN